MVWASTKDLPNNRNYVVKNRQIKNGALAKLSPTWIIRNFEINWGILKDLLTFWPCLRVCLLAVRLRYRMWGGRGMTGRENWSKSHQDQDRVLAWVRLRLCLSAWAQDFVKLHKLPDERRDQTRLVQSKAGSGLELDKTCGRFRDGWQLSA